MPRGVAIVQAHVDRVRGGLGHGVDAGPHVLDLGEVARRRDVLAGGWRLGGVEGVDVEVLVAVPILDNEEVTAVPAPEGDPDGPQGVGGDRLGRAEGLLGALDPQVGGPLVGLDEGDEPAVGRQLRARDLGIAEEELPIEDGRRLGLLDGRGAGREDRGQEPAGHEERQGGATTPGGGVPWCWFLYGLCLCPHVGSFQEGYWINTATPVAAWRPRKALLWSSASGWRNTTKWPSYCGTPSLTGT